MSLQELLTLTIGSVFMDSAQMCGNYISVGLVSQVIKPERMKSEVLWLPLGVVGETKKPHTSSFSYFLRESISAVCEGTGSIQWRRAKPGISPTCQSGRANRNRQALVYDYVKKTHHPYHSLRC